MSGHTPGPWAVKKMPFSHVIEESDGDTLAEITCYPYEVEEANARLMAAAPELLEAAKTAALIIDGLDHWSKSRIEALDALDNAIAKAESAE